MKILVLKSYEDEKILPLISKVSRVVLFVDVVKKCADCSTFTEHGVSILIQEVVSTLQ